MTSTLNHPSWLADPHEYAAHIRDAGERAFSHTYGTSIHNVAQSMRKTRVDRHNRTHSNVTVYPAHPQDFHGRTGVKVSLYGTVILWWLPDIDGAPTRFTVSIGSDENNTLTTRRWINGLCRAFNVKFYCWNHDGEPWAMWAYDDSQKLAVQSILPTDLIVAYAR